MELIFDDWTMMGLSVTLDLIVTILIVRVLCQKKLICNFNKPSLVLFNLLILIFCSILMRLDISMGMGVGLFAVLAMFRFRSEVLKTQEMFYLLLLIAIGFVHAAFPKVLSFSEVVVVDIVLLIMSYTLAFTSGQTPSKFKIIVDDLDLIKPNNELKLRNMLEERTGFVYNKIEIINVNLKKGRALIQVQAEPPSAPTLPERVTEKVRPTFEMKPLKNLAIQV